MSIRQWKAAISQAEPCWFNKVAGIEKTIRLISEAKENGAALVAFSEVWVPGYPNFLWGGNFHENIPLVHKYMANSLVASGPEVLAVRRAAAQHDMYVAFGFSERVGGTLYLAQMLIGPDGNVLCHRRKTKPTHMERTLFGDSTGDSLNNVVDTPLGKIGMLNCWEHLQPLLKYNTWAQGEQVHVAAWPFNGEHVGIEPWSVCNEANEVTMSRAYSIEGQVYTLVANQPLSAEGIRLNSEGQGNSKDSFMMAGGGGRASVFGPDGRQLTEPTDPLFDGLIYCDIDLDKIDLAKQVADPVGHYSRPDLLRLLVDDQPKTYVVKVEHERSSQASWIPAPTLLSQHKSLKEIDAEKLKDKIAGA
ncbi:carbon-nitrogen hydrolase [Hypoxylon rubiginosum]|uniref:Carbon-nitrogen hydrolase n=1 Tax=Hypoxylon rubiginosum TaxID=110542 RepID=A0ACC0CU26_9PEZI|nr:carbon-nitrogen hydrolase [Hypoxylon rubiginosum]